MAVNWATEGSRTCDRGLSLAFAFLGKRWNGILLGTLGGGPAGFAELKRAIPGISERMLSDRLTELAEAGLLVREVDSGPPLRVSYRLTEAGEALGPALGELGRWAERHLPGENPCGEVGSGAC